MDKPKRCPICCSDAQLVTVITTKFENGSQRSVTQFYCECEPVECSLSGARFSTKEDAIDSWNSIEIHPEMEE